MKVLEKDIQAAILDWLNTLPRTRAFRRNTGAMKANYKGKNRLVRFSQVGAADIWGVCAGAHFEIEVKRPGEGPSEAQQRWLEDLARVNAVCFVASSLEALQEQWPWEL